jgi:hypothetical protein
MDQTVDEIEADIDRTRARVGSNLRELEDRFEAATDWREHFRAHPWVFLGAASLFGFVMGAAIKPEEGVEQAERRSLHGPSVRQLTPMLDNLAEALMAVASTRVKSFIADMIPGFEEQLTRIEDRANPR